MTCNGIKSVVDWKNLKGYIVKVVKFSNIYCVLCVYEYEHWDFSGVSELGLYSDFILRVLYNFLC